MLLFITGATGAIGRRLVLDRIERGNRVVLLSRDPARTTRLFAADANSNIRIVEGDCSVPGPWQRAVDGVDGVVHLAGAGISDRRWNAEYRALIRRSRVDGTHQVVNAIEDARRRPTVLVSASATGYYGDAEERELDESAAPGDDFLAEVCTAWEQQVAHAESIGVRASILRIGVVLDPRAGALRKMLPFFRRGLGGPIGNGRQYVSWIHWRDVLAAIALAIENPRSRGALNVVSPNPVTNREFARALGDAIGRPAFMPAPWWLVRLLKGELANHLVMSQRAVPRRLLELGMRFAQPEIERAMRSLLAPTITNEAAVVALNAGMVAGAGVAGGLGDGAKAGPGAKRREPRSTPARVRLLAIDVDGTLLRTDGRLTGAVSRALHAAERSGCAVVLATARSPRLMRELNASLRLQSPTINANGAIIWNPLEERAQYHEAMSLELAWMIIRTARQVDPAVVIEIERLDHCHSDRIDPTLQVQINRLVQPDSIGPLATFLTAPVSRINLVAPPQRLAAVTEAIRRGFWRERRVALFQPHPALLQVTHPLADKGISLQRVANRMRCARAEVMAIGDAINDLGMLEWAGFAVAVGNAQPSVKALADVEAPSCDEAGVAWAIERFVLRRGTGDGPVNPVSARMSVSGVDVGPNAAGASIPGIACPRSAPGAQRAAEPPVDPPTHLDEPRREAAPIRPLIDPDGDRPRASSR